MTPPPYDNTKFIKEFGDDLVTYKNLTHQFNNYNEIFNMNIYMKQSSVQERARLERTNEMLKGRVIKLKQEFVLQDRTVNFMGLRNSLMYYTLVIICLMLLLVGFFVKKTISQNVLIVATVVIVTIFIISVVMVAKNHSNRRNIIWDQYYWKPMQTS
jgi:hypothetical protein